MPLFVIPKNLNQIHVDYFYLPIYLWFKVSHIFNWCQSSPKVYAIGINEKVFGDVETLKDLPRILGRQLD